MLFQVVLTPSSKLAGAEAGGIIEIDHLVGLELPVERDLVRFAIFLIAPGLVGRAEIGVEALQPLGWERSRATHFPGRDKDRRDRIRRRPCDTGKALDRIIGPEITNAAGQFQCRRDIIMAFGEDRLVMIKLVLLDSVEAIALYRLCSQKHRAERIAAG